MKQKKGNINYWLTGDYLFQYHVKYMRVKYFITTMKQVNKTMHALKTRKTVGSVKVIRLNSNFSFKIN